ncbi:hypothetical protein QR680_015831 [Steinernema hermaphroditum]|uniref:Uncharacterized protein n=1 Tax=Steinernema hermaphroditum TaxID=289476 RepID=A0AA39HA51_9BILA|nr:hypothetical protein QR680_015831 [Steinernema hermaphroditum]
MYVQNHLVGSSNRLQFVAFADMTLPRVDEEVMVRGEDALCTEFAGGHWLHCVDSLCISESANGGRFDAVGFKKVAEDSVLGGGVKQRQQTRSHSPTRAIGAAGPKASKDPSLLGEAEGIGATSKDLEELLLPSRLLGT